VRAGRPHGRAAGSPHNENAAEVLYVVGHNVKLLEIIGLKKPKDFCQG
jgi:hypothetical protein